MYDGQGKAVTDELAVSTLPDMVQTSPAISMNSSGSFVVVWSGWSGDEVMGLNYVYARVFNAGGSPASSEFRVNGLTQENWPDVALDDNGRFVVAWIRMGDTHNRPYGEEIMYRQFEGSGRAVGSATVVTDDMNCRWYGPAVAVDRTGNFVITWAAGPYPYDILAQGFSSTGAAKTPPYQVSSVAGNRGHPAVSSDGKGTFLVAWDNQCSKGQKCGVSVRPCTFDGGPTGKEVVVCDLQAERQWYGKPAMVGDGRYVIVWIGQASDGCYDVYAQTGSLTN